MLSGNKTQGNECTRGKSTTVEKEKRYRIDSKTLVWVSISDLAKWEGALLVSNRTRVQILVANHSLQKL